MRARADDLRWNAPPKAAIIRASGASAAKSKLLTPGMNAPVNSTPRARSGSAESASVRSRGSDAPAWTKTRIPGESRSSMSRGLLCIVFFGPALSDFRKPIVEDDRVALAQSRPERDLRAVDPHFGADRLAGEYRRGETQTHAF